MWLNWDVIELGHWSWKVSTKHRLKWYGVCVCVYVVVWAILCTLYRNISLLLLHVYIFLNDMFSFFHARAVCVVRRARMSSHLLFLRAEPSRSFSSGIIFFCCCCCYLPSVRYTFNEICCCFSLFYFGWFFSCLIILFVWFGFHAIYFHVFRYFYIAFN